MPLMTAMIELGIPMWQDQWYAHRSKPYRRMQQALPENDVCTKLCFVHLLATRLDLYTVAARDNANHQPRYRRRSSRGSPGADRTAAPRRGL